MFGSVSPHFRSCWHPTYVHQSGSIFEGTEKESYKTADRGPNASENESQGVPMPGKTECQVPNFLCLNVK